MKKFLTIISGGIIMAASAFASAQNFYDFTVKSIDGKDYPLSQLKGKKVMVVNVASKCGLTPQYAKIQALYAKYRDANFVVIGFPANNFMGQEPGTNEEIAKFCVLKYDVSFPMMAKISVKGDDMAPLYKWLTQKSQNGVEDSEVEWNFQKYLVNPDGTLAKVIHPKTQPDSEEVISWIEGK